MGIITDMGKTYISINRTKKEVDTMPEKIQSTGCLSADDAALFYKLWIGLLDYVNSVYGVNKKLGRITSPAGLEISSLLPIRDKLWGERTAISEYIFNNKNRLTEEETDILKGWKNAVAGDFILMKHLKKHTVLMTNEPAPLLYGAEGIMSTWEEMIPKDRLPTVINTVLIPFKGKIIYDSIVRGGNIRYGAGYQKGLNESYRSAKSQYGIITSFDELGGLLEKHASDSQRRQRISDEILVDAYDEYEQISAWNCYLEDALVFPFEALCEKEMIRSPLRIDEQVTAVKLADVDDCCEGIMVIIKWQDRKFAVPLEQLKPVNPDVSFAESIEDWKYWLATGCF